MLYFEINQMLCAFIFLFGAIWPTWSDVNLDRGLVHILSGAERCFGDAPESLCGACCGNPKVD